jgi:hypothetical protein
MEARESRARDAHSIESEEEESDGDETTSSMMDFIAPDDSSPVVGRRSRPQIIDSDSDDSNEEEEEDDEEEEEEEEVVSARPRQQERGRRRPNRPIVLDSDSEVSADSGDDHEESEAGNPLDMGDEHESDSSAINGGYSPLDHGDDSENDVTNPFAIRDHHSNTSDSGTTVGRHDLDDEEGESATNRNDGPSVSRRVSEPEAQRAVRRRGSRAKRQRQRIEDSDEERSSPPPAEFDASGDDNAATDQDGDVEMGAKSAARTRGSAVDHNGLEDFLGGTGTFPPEERPQRRRRAQAQISPTQEYDPRISMMFAQHQSDLRDATARESPLYESQTDAPRRIEAPSRSRRRNQYRLDQPILSNRFGPNREPIVISSSTRPGRAHRNRREYRA